MRFDVFGPPAADAVDEAFHPRLAGGHDVDLQPGELSVLGAGDRLQQRVLAHG